MYRSKSFLSARGQFEGTFVFIMKSLPFVRKTYTEIGYCQDVNIKGNKEQVIERALLNAFYKLNHRSQSRVFKNSDDNEIDDNVEDFKLVDYEIKYFEDRIYSYKRENIRGRYYYVIRRKGRIDSKTRPNYLNTKKEYRKIKSFSRKGLFVGRGDEPPPNKTNN